VPTTTSTSEWWKCFFGEAKVLVRRFNSGSESLSWVRSSSTSSSLFRLRR